MSKERNLKGFTLIEVLIVIGLIAILAAVTVIALNPTKNFQDARNAERRGEIAQIMNALNQYSIETVNSSSFTTLLTSVTVCGVADTNIITTPGAGLAVYTYIVPSQIAEIPADPSSGSATDTGYDICKTGTRLTIKAPSAEAGVTISLSR
jgi:prepilin-type N-terminal cleavage/methylation domain-containing protein